MNITPRFLAVLLLTLAALLAGCSKTPPPPAPLPPPTALTLEEWRALPIQEKYDGATFERLRMNNPQLQNEQNWKAYERQYILPERQKDIPTPPGQQPP